MRRGDGCRVDRRSARFELVKAVAWEADPRFMTGMMAEDWMSYVKR